MLKIFHLVFIAASAGMSLGVALWAFDAWRRTAEPAWLGLLSVALAGGAALVVYGSRFRQKFRKLGIAGLVLAGSLSAPSDALACPACVGTSDSVLQAGMNMGIITLLGVVFFMWVCFASFFVFLVRRAKRAQAQGSL